MEALTKLIEALTTLAWPVLVGVVLYKLAPSVKKILDARSFSVKYGDIELSVQDASDQLRKQIEDLQNQVAKLLGEQTTPPEQARVSSLIKTGKVLLWVDDKPKNNAFEVAKFQDDGFRVVQAKSTVEALQIVNEGLIPDVVITDMGRYENGTYKKDAGLVIIKELRSAGVAVPIFVYTSQKYAQQHHDQSLEVGGNGATASPVALFKIVEQAIT